MNRWILRLFVGCGVLLLAAPHAQAQVKDKVFYIDHNAPKPDPKKGPPAPTPPYEGEVTAEGPNGITIKLSTGPTKEVAATDIRDIQYDTRITGFDKIKGRFAEGVIAEGASIAPKNPAEEKEKTKNLDKAIDAYKEVQTSKNEKLTKAFLRQLEYKLASLQLLKAAGNKAGEDEAMKGLIAFAQKYPDGWQISGCLERIADYQMAREDYKSAVKSIEDILKLKLSKDMENKYQMMSADALVKSGDVAGAEKRIEAILSKLPKDDPSYFSLEMRRIKCKAGKPDQVNAAIAELTKKIKELPEDNKAQKAVAHNTLGDCYLMSKDHKGDAVYEFLLVEVWYPANDTELSKAYSELSKIYANDRKNEARAKEYQDKLAKLRAGK